MIKGTRVPVEIIIGGMAGGMTITGLCKEYRIKEEDVRAALAYAAVIEPGKIRISRLP